MGHGVGRIMAALHGHAGFTHSNTTAAPSTSMQCLHVCTHCDLVATSTAMQALGCTSTSPLDRTSVALLQIRPQKRQQGPAAESSRVAGAPSHQDILCKLTDVAKVPKVFRLNLKEVLFFLEKSEQF
jgi:hypothetical protein